MSRDVWECWHVSEWVRREPTITTHNTLPDVVGGTRPSTAHSAPPPAEPQPRAEMTPTLRRNWLMVFLISTSNA